MENELKQAKTMNEIFRICSKYYDLDQPLGIATKSIVIAGVRNAIKIVKAKPKQ